MERKKITFDSFIRGAIGCVLVVGILMLVERLSGVLLPFFIAWLIAYMVSHLWKGSALDTNALSEYNKLL
jgi:predicted PurR-regulated permease PerM